VVDTVTTPSVPFDVWPLAAFDPFLVILALVLGFKADQLGKVVLAAIMALAGSILLNWLVTAVGLPWIAPVSREGPLLIPVRAGAAVLWAALGYGVARWTGRGRPKERA
jgi:membrane-bound metal-dependent hydrolase YbcI (DUF457 family)